MTRHTAGREGKGYTLPDGPHLEFEGHEIFARRLCCTLVSDMLPLIDRELRVVKSVRFLADHPWVAGKRIRPIAFLLAHRAMALERGASPPDSASQVRLAAAIELLHEASLVHDDLVDRSILRRGKPAMHVVKGDGLALLIGDYMIFRGLKLILDAATSHRDIVLAQELAQAGLAITHGEINELYQFLNRRERGQRIRMGSYLAVIVNKTAHFFAGCVEAGAAHAGAGSAERAAFRSFGLNLGIAFQMVDDLMDVLGAEEKAKKTLRHDLVGGTITLPMIHAYERMPRHPLLSRLARGGALSRRDQEKLYLLLRSGEVIARCRATLKRFCRRAEESLAHLPGNIYRLGLADLLDYTSQGLWTGVPAKILK